jgi:hypothetical protein
VNRLHTAPGEWRWVLLASLAVILFASLPTIYAWSLADADHAFTGFVYNTEDGNSYIAKMRLGARGEWLFRLPFTTEPHSKAWLYSFHILLGKLAAGLGLSLQLTYHLARAILGLGLLVTIYAFVARFVPDMPTRRLAWVLTAIGSGLGWLLTALGATHWLGDLPLDFWVPEAYVFLVVYSLPHLALAEMALLWAFLWLLDAFAAGNARYALLSGLSTLVMTIIVPFYPAVVGSVIGIYLAVLAVRQRRAPWREIGLAALALSFSVPVVIYNLWLTSSEPVYRAWARQLRMLSPNPLHYLLGYAPLLVPAIWGLKALATQKRPVEDGPAALPTWLLPIAWLVAAPVLAYLPFTAQRRLIVLAQVPLSMLAAMGLRGWFGDRRWAYTGYVIASSLSVLLLTFGSLGPIGQKEIPVYRPATEEAALAWLAAHATPGEAVLASFEAGNVIPARTDLIVFAGHGPETLHSIEKQNMIRRFFAPQTDDAWRRSLLVEFNVDYVFLGPLERALGDWNPAAAPYLVPVYNEGGITIFRVAREEIEQ